MRGYQISPHWLEVALPAILRPKLNKETQFRIQFNVDDYSFALSARDNALDVIRGQVSSPDFTLNLSYEIALAIMSGSLNAKTLSESEIIPGKMRNRVEAVRLLQGMTA